MIKFLTHKTKYGNKILQTDKCCIGLNSQNANMKQKWSYCYNTPKLQGKNNRLK